MAKTTQKTEIYELTPTNGRKSFYKKAKVIIVNGWRFLRSYDTIMGGIDPDGNAHRYSDYHSKTTIRHVQVFFPDPAAFWKLPCERQPAITVVL